MPPSKLPSSVNRNFYVGDSRTFDLTGVTVDGVPVDLSDAEVYAVSGSIRADRDPDTPATATLTVTFPVEGTVRVRLTPDQAEALGDLIQDAEPDEVDPTQRKAKAALDVQVEVLEGGEVVDRTTLLSDTITVGGDVTR